MPKNTITIKIIDKPIGKVELRILAKEIFGDMVKGTADIALGKMALGGELHIDSNQLLIKSGSAQKDIWGFNIYPENDKDDRIEYNSLVNIKPALQNKSAGINDKNIRHKVKEVIMKYISFGE